MRKAYLCKRKWIQYKKYEKAFLHGILPHACLDEHVGYPFHANGETNTRVDSHACSGRWHICQLAAIGY